MSLLEKTRGGSRGRDDLQFSNTAKKNTMWFIGVEVEQEASAPPPKKNPGSTPENSQHFATSPLVSPQNDV